MTECVHCFDDGTPVYPHDGHETREAYVARQEAALIREALDLHAAWDQGYRAGRRDTLKN